MGFAEKVREKTKKPASDFKALVAERLLEREGINEDPGFFEQAGNLFSGADRREFDAPELPVVMRRGDEIVKIQEKLAFARGNPLAATDIFNKEFPDIQVENDSFGNPFIRDKDNNPVFLNAPGASLGDIPENIITFGSELAGATAGGKLLQGFGKFGQVIGAGLGTGAASITQDKIAQILGSKQPVDIKRAGLMTLFGAGGEAAGLAMGSFLGKIFRNRALVDNAGGLTRQGQAIVSRAGIDPNLVSREFIDVFRTESRRAANPVDAAVLADAQSLPVPVNLSRGDITRDVGQQAFEDAASKGGRGTGARQEMAPFVERKDAQLKANVPEVQAQIGQGARVATPGQGIEAARGALATQEDILKRAVDSAYTLARSTGASIEGQLVKSLALRLRTHIDDSFDLQSSELSGVRRAITRLHGELGDRTAVTLDRLDRIVRQLNSAAKSNNPTQNTASGNASKFIMDFVDEMANQSLIRGDPRTLRALLRGKIFRRMLGQRFQAKDVVQKILERRLDGTFKLTPEDSINSLFTLNGAGMKSRSTEAAVKIKRLLGPNSPEFLQLKEEAFFKLLSSQGKGGARGQGLDRIFSADKFSTAMDDAMRDSPGLMRAIFDPPDISLLQQFKRIALRAKNRVPGSVNTSAGTIELMRAMEGSAALRNNIFFRPVITVFKKLFLSRSNTLKARDAIGKPIKQRVVRPPTGLGAAIGAQGGK